jgi:hypothetical protein
MYVQCEYKYLLLFVANSFKISSMNKRCDSDSALCGFWFVADLS